MVASDCSFFPGLDLTVAISAGNYDTFD